MILLKRNSENDASYCGHQISINEGDTVALLSVDNQYTFAPATVVVNLPRSHPEAYLNPFYADLNCFDYVRHER